LIEVDKFDVLSFKLIRFRVWMFKGPNISLLERRWLLLVFFLPDVTLQPRLMA